MKSRQGNFFRGALTEAGLWVGASPCAGQRGPSTRHTYTHRTEKAVPENGPAGDYVPGEKLDVPNLPYALDTTRRSFTRSLSQYRERSYLTR
jgi:hypothetical protein